MAYKRPSDSLVAIPETKRSRNEIAAYTNKDKQLLELVSIKSGIEHNLTILFMMPNKRMLTIIVVFRVYNEHQVC